MTRSLFWVAAALALSASLSANQNRATAQESADAPAEAAADTNQAGGEASAGTSGSADAQQSKTESDAQTTSGSDAAAQSDAQSSTSSDAASGQSSAAGAQDTSAETDADASATPSQNQAPANQNRRSNQNDAATKDRAAAGADASVHGRVNVDARAHQRRQHDMRRGIQFGRATNRGLAINIIERNSIYFDSGFRRGDVIVSLHGRRIRSEADFMRWVVLHPGQRVPVVVLRDGRRETIYVVYPREVAHTDRVYVNRPGSQAYLGVTFYAQVRDAVIVRSVAPGSPAEEAGLQRGDMIVALNGEQVMSYPDAISIIRSMQPGERLDIIFERGRSERQTEAVLAGQPRGPVRTATRDSEIYVEERQAAPVQQPEDRRIIINRRDNDRRLRDRNRDRPARRRLLD